MNRLFWKLAISCMAVTVAALFLGCDSGPANRFANVPSKYSAKHMPADWWDDQSIVEEGRNIYVGNVNRDVKCAKCHGRGGSPVIGAQDFRDTATMKRFSDSHLLWSIAEGVPGTRMRGFKGKLSEDQMWKVIAFIRTFGLNGLRYDPERKQWEPIAEG